MLVFYGMHWKLLTVKATFVASDAHSPQPFMYDRITVCINICGLIISMWKSKEVDMKMENPDRKLGDNVILVI